MTQPIYVEQPASIAEEPADHVPDEILQERLRTLETEIFTLRDTMGRFAELVLDDLKKIREVQSQPRPQAAGLTMQPVMEMPAATTTPHASESMLPDTRWLILEVFNDWRMGVKMYFDARYRMRRSTQILLPVFITLFVLNTLFLSFFVPIPIVSPILGKLIDILLAVLLYKVLNREIIRYRQALDQLEAWFAMQKETVQKRIIDSGDSAATQVDLE